MHNRIAVDAVIGSSPRMRAAVGITAAAGSAEKRMIRNPITAFQKPTTIQGSVTANSASSVTSIKAEAARRQRQRGERQQPGHGGGKQGQQTASAGANIIVSGGGGLHGLRVASAPTRGYDF